MADLFITGQFGTVAAITAVSIGSQIMHMLTVMIAGLAMGTTVSISLSIGRGDREKASLCVGNTATLFMALSLALSIVLLVFIKPIVGIMSTPAEAADLTADYLRVCFMGIPFITAYNIINSVFRGLGNSKTPMHFVATACLANIALDYLFIGFFRLGPLGAALGTTLSQAFSVIIALITIQKTDIGIFLSKTSFNPNLKILRQIFKIGIPVSLQDGFIQIAFIVITVIANRRGLNDAAAVGIVEKVIGIFFLVPSSMLSAVSAICAQNIGAGKSDRARKTLGFAICIAACFGIVISMLTQIFSMQIVSIFEDDKNVAVLGSQYLRSYVWDCVLAGIHFCFSGYFCALEKSGISFLHNVLSIILVRIPAAYIASYMFPNNLYPMGLAAPLGSLLSVIICVLAYLVLKSKKKL